MRLDQSANSGPSCNVGHGGLCHESIRFWHDGRSKYLIVPWNRRYGHARVELDRAVRVRAATTEAHGTTGAPWCYWSGRVYSIR
eukprot:COSAG02_NODE_9290_length_2265_cov_1.508772_2_plen_84_part_00